MLELPRQVYIEVTNRCNSRCETCVRTFKPREPERDLSLDEFRLILGQFPRLERAVLHGLGEPLLNPQLPEMIAHVKALQPQCRVLFNSNAVLLDEGWRQALIGAGLDEYRISLDAATAGMYARIRGVDAFDRVTENVRRFAQAIGEGNRPRLSLWFTAIKENLGELPAVVDLAAAIGVREVYVQRLVWTGRGLAQAEQALFDKLQAEEHAALAEAAARAAAHGLLFSASGLSSPEDSLRRQANLDRPWSACQRPWMSTYITVNGNVLRCCISPFSARSYEELILGNVFETPFEGIWNGPLYARLREALPTAEPWHPCEGCGAKWSL